MERARPPSEHVMIPLSILELVRVTQETDARGALNNARDLAAHAEKWGYQRVWVAEHHNMAGIASAATAVVLAHIAEGTKTIRVGAGGIMLPNHAPYIIAEQFGTLARLFPGRIDLGLRPRARHRSAYAARLAPSAGGRRHLSAGRSGTAGVPGSGRLQISASRRCRRRERKCRSISSDRAISARCWPPNWGCLTRSRRISRPTISLRRCRFTASRFKPSEQLDRPYAIVGVNIVAADTDEKARRLGDDSADVVHEHLPRRAGLKPAADRRH